MAPTWAGVLLVFCRFNFVTIKPNVTYLWYSFRGVFLAWKVWYRRCGPANGQSNDQCEKNHARVLCLSWWIYMIQISLSYVIYATIRASTLHFCNTVFRMPLFVMQDICVMLKCQSSLTVHHNIQLAIHQSQSTCHSAPIRHSTAHQHSIQSAASVKSDVTHAACWRYTLKIGNLHSSVNPLPSKCIALSSQDILIQYLCCQVATIWKPFRLITHYDNIIPGADSGHRSVQLPVGKARLR